MKTNKVWFVLLTILLTAVPHTPPLSTEEELHKKLDDSRFDN